MCVPVDWQRIPQRVQVEQVQYGFVPRYASGPRSAGARVSGFLGEGGWVGGGGMIAFMIIEQACLHDYFMITLSKKVFFCSTGHFMITEPKFLHTLDQFTIANGNMKLRHLPLAGCCKDVTQAVCRMNRLCSCCFSPGTKIGGCGPFQLKCCFWRQWK